METSITAGPKLSLAVTATSEHGFEFVLRRIVEEPASRPGVALVRIGSRPSVHVPNARQERAHSHEEIEHLRLVASEGNPFSRRALDEHEFAWLELFANHAVVAIANARAFEEVAERQKAEGEVRELASGLEAKIRRLVEANVVRIVLFSLEGAISGANDADAQTPKSSDSGGMTAA